MKGFGFTKILIFLKQPLKLLYFACIPHMSFIWAVNKIRLQYNLTFTLNINTRPDLDCQHIWMATGGNICTILLLLLMLHAGEGRELQYLSSFNFGDLSFSSSEAIIEDYVTLANAPQARHVWQGCEWRLLEILGTFYLSIILSILNIVKRCLHVCPGGLTQQDHHLLLPPQLLRENAHPRGAGGLELEATHWHYYILHNSQVYKEDGTPWITFDLETQRRDYEKFSEWIRWREKNSLKSLRLRELLD